MIVPVINRRHEFQETYIGAKPPEKVREKKFHIVIGLVTV